MDLTHGGAMNSASTDILETTKVGDFEVQVVKTDAIERFMPLTRPGLPEHLQGLMWIDQWGILGGSNIGTKEQLQTLGPDFFNQKQARARPDLIMSFAGMPFEDIGDKHVSYVAVVPTDAGNWSWFGITRAGFASAKSFSNIVMYRFIFNADWTQCYLVPSTASDLPDTLRLTMTYQGDNIWHRKTYSNPELTGDTFHYTAHRIVDGKGQRQPAYADYLSTANLPEVSGTEYPESIVVIRRAGATDNSQLVSTLPDQGAWPAYMQDLL